MAEMYPSIRLAPSSASIWFHLLEAMELKGLAIDGDQGNWRFPSRTPSLVSRITTADETLAAREFSHKGTVVLKGNRVAT